ESLQGGQAFAKDERLTAAGRPEGFCLDAVGAEHDHQALLAALLIGESQAGQIEQKRQGCRGDPQIAEKLASRAGLLHFPSPTGQSHSGRLLPDRLLSFDRHPNRFWVKDSPFARPKRSRPQSEPSASEY